MNLLLETLEDILVIYAVDFEFHMPNVLKRLYLSYEPAILVITGLFLGYTILALPRVLSSYTKLAWKKLVSFVNKCKRSNTQQIEDDTFPDNEV